MKMLWINSTVIIALSNLSIVVVLGVNIIGQPNVLKMYSTCFFLYSISSIVPSMPILKSTFNSFCENVYDE